MICCLQFVAYEEKVDPWLLKYYSAVIEIVCFPEYGQLPVVDVDKHQDGSPSKGQSGQQVSPPEYFSNEQNEQNRTVGRTV